MVEPKSNMFNYNVVSAAFVCGQSVAENHEETIPICQSVAASLMTRKGAPLLQIRVIPLQKEQFETLHNHTA